MTATEQKWTQLVHRWRESGQTAREFSTGRGFSAGGLRHWAWRLKKAGIATGVTGASPSSPAKTATRGDRAPDRVRLIRLDHVAVSTPGLAALTIEVGSARLRIPPGADPALLRATIGALIAAVDGGAP